MAKRHLLLGLVTLGLSACVTPYPSDGGKRESVLVEDRVLPGQNGSSEIDGTTVQEQNSSEPANPLFYDPSISSESLRPEMSESPVVKSLLASADQQSRAGDADAAANSLERALRIEQSNATLWSRLAEIRFDQKEWRQAIQLAAKSNVLSGDNRDLRRRNWYLMVNAYDAVGDIESAQKYREKVATPSY